MSILVIYYSYEGNTEFVAKTIAEHLKADVLKLEPRQEEHHKGFKKYIWGGKQVFFTKRPDLKPVEKNPQDYDVLFIGTPVWAFNYAPVLNSFFVQSNFENKRVVLFCCSQGGNGNTLKNMRKQLEGNEIVAEKAFLEPLSHDIFQERRKILDWVEEINQGWA